MFSNSFSNSISLATVTPSLVTCGPPNDLLMITFLPLGPSVTLTESARASTPLFNPSLASISNFISFAILIVFIYIIARISFSDIIK